MLLTTEPTATRALTTVLRRSRELAGTWLTSLGIAFDEVLQVSHEVVRDGRRHDILLRAALDNRQFDVLVEAKLEDSVDIAQLQDALRSSSLVVSLYPESTDPPHVDGVIDTTWEEVVALLRQGRGADAVSSFIADELEILLSSDKIINKRQLTKIADPGLRRGWTFRSGTSGRSDSLRVIRSPDRGRNFVSVEFMNWRGGDAHPLEATIMMCSQTSEVDETVWAALAMAAQQGLPEAPKEVTQRTHGSLSRRTVAEKETARRHGVSRAWTYGYGERQLQQYGWAGFGVRFSLLADQNLTLVEHATTVAYAFDEALRQIKKPKTKNQAQY